VLLRLACLAVTNTFSLIRLLPMSEREKEIEILVLRHQLTVLRRQATKPAFTPDDRFLLAGLLHHLPVEKLRRLLLLLRPNTILRWHHDLLKQRHAATRLRRRRGRPRTLRSIRTLALRLAKENPHWGYRRVHGELAALGSGVAASTVWEIFKEHGIDPAPQRDHSTSAALLHGQAEAILACDFFEIRTLTGARLNVFAMIEHATRRIRVLEATTHPTAAWVVQSGRNLVVDLEDAKARAKFMIRDRDSKFTAAFDPVLADAGIEVVLSGVRMPRMNSITERWAQTCRRELLDRTLIWNERHLHHALREFEQFYNGHRPHRTLGQAAPLRALPEPMTDPEQIMRLDVRRHDRLGGILHDYRHAA
jgi:transposase InsO family protein